MTGREHSGGTGNVSKWYGGKFLQLKVNLIEEMLLSVSDLVMKDGIAWQVDVYGTHVFLVAALTKLDETGHDGASATVYSHFFSLVVLPARLAHLRARARARDKSPCRETSSEPCAGLSTANSTFDV